jgi:hypothetical protein
VELVSVELVVVVLLVELLVGVVVLEVVLLVELVVGVELVDVGVLLVVGVVVVWCVVVVRQPVAASSPTVLAPWMRLARRVGLTDAGRFPTAWLKPETAVAAEGQLPALTAEATASS